MHHRLPRRFARVDAQVVAVGLQRRVELGLHHRHRRPDRLLLLGAGVEPGGHVPPRHHQRVALGYREAVAQSDHQRTLPDDAGGIDVAEGAGHGGRVDRGVGGEPYPFGVTGQTGPSRPPPEASEVEADIRAQTSFATAPFSSFSRRLLRPTPRERPQTSSSTPLALQPPRLPPSWPPGDHPQPLPLGSGRSAQRGGPSPVERDRRVGPHPGRPRPAASETVLSPASCRASGSRHGSTPAYSAPCGSGS
jgi:hypothetical protein